MHITVEPTRILIGAPDFVPRFLGLPKVWQIPPGSTEEALPDSTWDYIEVAGTLRISRTRPTKLTFTHLFILPGGHLDCGMDEANDPIPAGIHVEFIVRDVALAATDPFQWGNGLLNFGRRDMCGAPKRAWSKATTGLPKGSTSVTLTDDPVGWAVGDALLVTETRIVPAAIPRQLNPFPNRESSVTIKSITGRVVEFTAPLGFDHLALIDPKGVDVAYPRIANLTRNIVIRSENANGTPGHMADVGMDATWCECYDRNRQMGRTKNIPLNDIDPITLTPGTNQKGRYADHKHHAQGFGSTSKGIVLEGVDQKVGPKWGLAVHNVSDAVVEDNIAVAFPGAGFVTEDGNEVRNVFGSNFAAYCMGPHDGTPGAESSAIKVGNPGATGNGFFFRGVKNVFDGNEAWNCFIGIDLFTQEIGSFTPLFYPSVPGGPNDTLLTLAENKPISFTKNIGNSNAVTGLEFWFVTEFEAHDSQLAFNGQFQFLQGTSNPAAPFFVNVDCVGDAGQTQGITSSLAYAQQMTVKGGRIVGCEIGIPDGGANGFVILRDVFFQNALDIDYRDLPQVTQHTNCVHEPLPGRPAHFIKFGRAGVWDGTGTPPETGVSVWRAQQGSKQYLVNWQGTGKNYQLLTEQQLGSLPAAYSSNPPVSMAFNTPLAGVTVAESWASLGMAPYGDMVRDAEAARLDGIPLGYAREGEHTPLGPPLFIITSPTPRAPAFTFLQDGSPNRQMRLYGVLTGDGTGISQDILLSIDGSTPVKWSPNPDIIGADNFTMTMDAVPEGNHEATTWRVDLAGAKVDSSVMAFPFVVGPVVVPPPLPPPPPTINAPILDGATHVTGLGRSGATVTIFVDGIETASGTVGDAVTAFDIQVAALHAGQAIRATQKRQGQTSSPSNTVIVSAAPVTPPPPVLHSPLAAGAMQVTGTAIPDAIVSVSVDGAVHGSGSASTAGVFDVMVMPVLAEGQHVSATQTVGGLTSNPSNMVVVSSTPDDWHPIAWERLGTTDTFRIVG